VDTADGSRPDAAARSAPGPALDGELLRALVGRYEAAWHAKDIDGFLACHTEDAVWEVPLFYPDGIVQGHAAIRAECERAWRGMSDMRYATHELFLSLDRRRAAQLWTGRFRLTGTIDPPGYAATNQPVEFTGVSVWELRGQRLSRVSEYFDALGPGRQIGLVPAPGSPGERAAVLLQRLKARQMRSRSGDPAAGLSGIRRLRLSGSRSPGAARPRGQGWR